MPSSGMAASSATTARARGDQSKSRAVRQAPKAATRPRANMPMRKLAPGLKKAISRSTLTTPTPYFLNTLSHTTTYPVPRAVVEEHGDAWVQPANLVGNGAYTLASHNLGVEIVFEKNPEYWDAENDVMQTERATVRVI